jgi:hypothetical protein
MMRIHGNQLRSLKWLLWLYFWLLIFEGALRKWFLPQLSSPLLIVRDPVVMTIYMLAFSRGIFPRNRFIQAIVILATLSFFASFAGIATMKVTIFGIHSNFLHLPLIFLIPVIFDADDVKSVGKWLLILSAPMAVLVVLQFRASPDARINAAAGGEIAGQMFAAVGKIRPPGVFSFVTGMVSYLSLVTAFLMWHFLDAKIYPRLLVITSTAAAMLSLAVSGSRSAVVAVTIVSMFSVLICIRKGVSSLAGLKYVLIIGLVCAAMYSVPVFREGLVVQQERFESGGGIHEGIVDRFFGELASSLSMCSKTPLLGLGLGLGTNAGAGILSGERQFLLSEGEWGRVILESGPVLGIAFILLRFAILCYVFGIALKALRLGNSLPLLLVGATGLDLLTGQFGQSTELGFVVFTCGLCLVPAGHGNNLKEPESGLPGRRVGQDMKKILGRSVYAELLHSGKPKD